MQTITCPSCSSEFTKRVRRNTRIGRALAIFYIYPFRCQLCERAFKIFQPGIRYIRMDEDRRDHRRISIDFPAWLKKDIVNCSGSATEISMKGCTIRTDSRLPLMSLVSVGLEVPQRPQPLTIETAVVRNSPPPAASVWNFCDSTATNGGAHAISRRVCLKMLPAEV